MATFLFRLLRVDFSLKFNMQIPLCFHYKGYVIAIGDCPTVALAIQIIVTEPISTSCVGSVRQYI